MVVYIGNAYGESNEEAFACPNVVGITCGGGGLPGGGPPELLLDFSQSQGGFYEN